VVFLPPTLIASIYGMNFSWMPERDWSFGYPVSIVLMIISAVMPFLYFKRRGWL
jgi:magnesium transporter